jgi:hypothetical protein
MAWNSAAFAASVMGLVTRIKKGRYTQCRSTCPASDRKETALTIRNRTTEVTSNHPRAR